MKHIVVMSMQAVKKKLNPEARNYCFEVFGYDFVVDEKFKVWLIEVNTNPCLEESSDLLRMLLPRMIGRLIKIVDDAFKLTVDCVFPGRKKEKVYAVTGYSDTENMWEYLQFIATTDNKRNISFV